VFKNLRTLWNILSKWKYTHHNIWFFYYVFWTRFLTIQKVIIAADDVNEIDKEGLETIIVFRGIVLWKRNTFSFVGYG
jgi:hypothetical protein